MFLPYRGTSQRGGLGRKPPLHHRPPVQRLRAGGRGVPPAPRRAPDGIGGPNRREICQPRFKMGCGSSTSESRGHDVPFQRSDSLWGPQIIEFLRMPPNCSTSSMSMEGRIGSPMATKERPTLHIRGFSYESLSVPEAVFIMVRFRGMLSRYLNRKGQGLPPWFSPSDRRSEEASRSPSPMQPLIPIKHSPYPY